jgi:glycine/sarcosine N-methyltransferase
MNIDTYKDIAERYDLSSEQSGAPELQIAEFFSTLFSRNDVHSVLDCACGTGRHLLLFYNLGCEAWGSDASGAMLEQARKNLAHHGIQAPLLRSDYRDLPQRFDRSFDAVVCLASIGYMPDETQFLRAFNSMHAVLRKGGILVLTAIPTDRQWEERPRFKLVSNTPDVTRLFVMDYFERTIGYHILDIFHSQEANELKVWNAELTVSLRDDQERLLRAAGFSQVDFYGSFDFNPYDKRSSERLITVAYK